MNSCLRCAINTQNMLGYANRHRKMRKRSAADNGRGDYQGTLTTATMACQTRMKRERELSLIASYADPLIAIGFASIN